jgi:hypothetical protein
LIAIPIGQDTNRFRLPLMRKRFSGRRSAS